MNMRILIVSIPILIFMLSLNTDNGIHASAQPHGIKLHEQYETHPARGMLLIARRGMPDPRFRQTVILLATYDKGSSLGLIVNQTSTTTLKKLLPDMRKLDKQAHRIYFGGPVGLQRLKFLFRSKDEPQDATHILSDLYISGSRETLEQMLKEDKSPEELRIYLGYTGWGPQQLDTELAHHDWHLHQAKIEDIFTKHTDILWQRLIDHYEPEGQLVERHQDIPIRHGYRPVSSVSTISSLALYSP
ncbi:MAG: YqgE/AlgH family protein [Gammaproteobacteria bacterium]|nr:YqgE/AlgH family protein [Gammaproteobacteria bacterium]